MALRTTTLSEFQAELRETGSYRTHDDCRAPARAKPGAWTTLRYSWALTRVFPLCAIAEPLGKLTTDLWAQFCFSSVTKAEKLGMNVIVEGFQDRIALYPHSNPGRRHHIHQTCADSPRKGVKTVHGNAFFCY